MKKLFSLIAAVLFAGSMMAGTVTLTMEDYQATEFSGQGISVTTAKNSSTTAPAYNATFKDLRVYAKGSITLSAQENITAISFVISSQGKKRLAPLTASEGSVVVTGTPDFTAEWTGAAKSVTLTVGDKADYGTEGNTKAGQLDFTAIVVTYDGEGGDIPVVYDTITVAQAIEIANALDDKATSAKKYYVEGFAVNVAEYSPVYGNQDFFMVDDVNAPDSILMAYRTNPKKDGQAYAVLAGDQVRAFGKLKKFVDSNKKVQLEIDQPLVEFIKETEGDHSIPEPQYDTITVARALEIGGALESGKSTTDFYVIEGYVTALTDSKGNSSADGGWAQYKNQCMWIADTYDESAISKDKAFMVYQGVATDSTQITKKAKISMKCAIKNYNGTIENASYPITVTVLEKGEDPVPPTQETMDTITVARALEIGGALEANKTSDSIYVIAGYVSKIVTPFDSTKMNETFWMVDEKGGRAATNAAGAFEVYRGKMDTVADLDAMVYVTAKIYKYQPMKDNQPSGDPVIETASSPIPAVHVEEAGTPEVIESINVAQALEIGEKLADKAVSEMRYEITGYVSYIDEPYSKQFGNETFWITDTKGERTNDKTKAFEVYRGKPNTNAEIYLDAQVKIVCYIKNFGGTIENDGNNIPFEVLETGVTPNTINVKKAIAEIAPLEEGATTQDMYVVKGYIAEVTSPYDTKYNNMTISMTDKFNRLEGDLTAYRAKIDKNDLEGAVAGAYVQVFGYLQKHAENDFQVVNGKIYIAEAPKVDTVAITVAQAIEIAASLEKGEEADVFYAVTGYVADIIEVGEGTQSFWMSDSETETEGDLYIDNVKIAAPAAAHQQVRIYGWVGKDTDGDARILNGDAEIIWGEGIEQIVLTEKAQKVVVDGAIYIIRDNKLYNLQGAQVR